MDMRKYCGSTFYKVDDVRDGPRRERIAGVVDGKFDRPDLVFESGRKLGTGPTNNKTLVGAYGIESDDWIGHVIELYLGQTKYNGASQDAVLVRPISKPEHYGTNGGTTDTSVSKQGEPGQQPAPKSLRHDMDDDIPF
jgi:hypothetical protein